MAGAKWQSDERERYIEVTPLHDLREHTSGSSCWCRPVIDREVADKPLIVHHSMDGRERTEPDMLPEYQEGTV